jgi:hypothetical protein
MVIHTNFPAICVPDQNKVIAPNMIAMLGPQPKTTAIIEPKATPGLLLGQALSDLLHAKCVELYPG